jgi:hypothetical protein
MISRSEVVAEMDSAIDVIEINETGPSGEAQCAYRGDGTRFVSLMVKNTAGAPVVIGEGDLVGVGSTVAGSVDAAFDGNALQVDRPAPRHRFDRLEWLPVTYVEVVIFYCGIGGFEAGLAWANRSYGTSFRVVLGLDNDQVSIGIHQRTHGVKVINYTLGGGFEAALDMVAKYNPRGKWARQYFHASPSCKEGSTANLRGRDLGQCVRMTKWSADLMMRAQVGFWTLEQVPGVYRFLQGHVPWVRVLEFREYTGLTAGRKRVIAASAPLDLVALTPSEMEKVFVSPEALLRKRRDRPYNLGDGPVKIRNGFGAETGLIAPRFR